MNKVTARDVADACATSIAAVSRAFRADAPISSDLRDRILREAARLGYVPPRRRGRRVSRVISFALIVGDIENPFYPQVLRAFSREAADLGWEALVYVAPEVGSVDSLMAHVLRADVDAVVIASAELSSTLAAQCHDRALPVILFNRVQARTGLNAVCSDNYAGGQMAAQHLIGTGRSRIAFIGGRRSTSTHLERRRGLIDALAKRQMRLSEDLVCDYAYDVAATVGHTLFARATRPDGIFCANDNMAFALLDAAFEAGLRPGQDVSIIGYDDVPMAGWSRYRLTTLSQNVPDMVARTVDRIAELVTTPQTDARIEIVPPQLIVRHSG
ncbi:MAG: substrate-binding domain-containing protein [Pseudomonadota bacterium]